MSGIVTLLFVDQVGSTAQLAALGDVRAQRIRTSLFDALREATEAHGGREVDFTGDGLFAAFDAASAGAQAAVMMQQSVDVLNRRRPPPEHVAIRVGVHVGEPIAQGAGYFGQAVVVARRLCDRADAGEILVSNIMQSLLGPHGTYVFDPIGELLLKGIDEPVSTFSLAYTHVESGVVLPPELVVDDTFVGRADMLAWLHEQWRSAAAGQRAIVLVDSEAGMGATSLAAAFATSVVHEAPAVWYGRAEPGARLSAWAGVVRSCIATMSRAELRLTLGPQAKELARAVPELTSELPGLAEPSAIDAEAAAHLVVDALQTVVARAAAAQPVLVVLDNADDADDLTLAVVRRLLSVAGPLQLMVLVLHRVQSLGRTRLSDLAAERGVVSRELRGLDLAEVSALLQRFTGAVPDEQLARSLLAESEGSPFFVTRMARVQAERFVERRVVDSVQRVEAVRDDLRLVREELSLNLRQLDELRTTDADETRATPIDPDGTPPAVVACPYQGLAAFQAEHADWFFGREPLVAEVIAKLASSSFVGLVGSSGSGKSSLARAGILPALARGALPGSETWLRVIVSPGGDPYGALAEALSELAEGAAAADVVQRVRAHGVAGTAAALLHDCGAGRLVLFVDQFEELFTSSTKEVAAGFIGDLVSAANSADVVVVVSLRADFYGECAIDPEFAALLQDSQVLVGPMSRAELHRAVSAPAQAVGLFVEPGLADTIVHDAGDEPGLLPLVSTALLETWERRRGRSLTLSGYAEAGGVRGAIGRLAEDTFESLDEEGRIAARRTMLRLADSNEHGDDFRRRVLIDEIAAGPTSRETLALLADRRLITIDGSTCEIAHEVLFRTWPRLRQWLDEDREGRRLAHQIAAAAGEWERSGRDDALLLRGSRMSAANEFLTGGRADLSAPEIEYVEASAAKAGQELVAARRTSRRLRGLLVAVGVVLVVALVAGAVALVQRGRADNEATRARARGLAAQSSAMLQSGLQTSLLLAGEAFHEDDSLESRGSLLGALNGARQLVGYLPNLPKGLLDSAVNGDGTRMMLLTDDGTLQLFDTKNWTPIGAPLAENLAAASEVTSSPDGTLVAASSRSGTQVYDFATGAPVGPLLGDGGVFAARFSHDNHLLVTTAAFVPDITVWDIASATMIGEVRLDDDDYVSDMMVMPDDGSLLVWSEFTQLYRFDLATFERMGEPRINEAHRDLGTGTIDISPDGKRVLLGSVGNLVLQYDLATFEPIGFPISTSGSRTGDARYIENGSQIVTSGDDGAVAVFEASTGGRLVELHGLSAPANAVSYLGEGRLFASSVNEAGEWDLARSVADGSAIHHGLFRVLDCEPMGVERDRYVMSGGVLTPDNSDLQGAVEIRSMTDGALIASNTDLGLRQIDNVELAPDGESIYLVGSSFQEGGVVSATRVLHLSIPSLEPIGEPIDVPENDIARSMALSPDGRMLALGTRFGKLLLIDVETGSLAQPTRQVDSHSIMSLAWSDDMDVLFVGGQDGILRGVDPVGDAPTSELPLSPDFTLIDVEFTPDRSELVIASESGAVFFVDVASRQVVGSPLLAGATQLQAVDITPDGSMVAAAARDGSVQLWDVATGRAIGPAVAAHDAQPTELFFTADAGAVVTVAFDDLAVEMNVPPATGAARACELARRNLTKAEWAQYMDGQPYRRTCPQYPAGL